MEILNFKLKDIKPYEKNPRKNDEAVEFVANSIKEFGFKNPIILDENNVIVCGHTRYKASLKLGLEEVPCIVASDLTPEQIKAFRLADNKTSEKSEWDFDLLKDEILSIKDLDMTCFDFDIDLFSEKEIVEDDYEVVLPEEPKSKLGDIYQLGNHRLMCGDSTSELSVEKLMNGNKTDLFLTDPPYNVDYTGKDKNEMKIQNDNMGDDSFYDLLLNAFKNAYYFMNDGASFYIWHSSREVQNFLKAVDEACLSAKQQLIWNKNSLIMGRQDYQWKHEPCIYGWKETSSHKWYGDRKQTTVINWDRPSVSDLHPTMKPIGLFCYLINNSSKKDDIILDLFGGSGTTLIACEQLNRNCYMMELDPRYVDVIIDRWEKFTGNKAVKLN